MSARKARETSRVEQRSIELVKVQTIDYNQVEIRLKHHESEVKEALPTLGTMTFPLPSPSLSLVLNIQQLTEYSV